MKPSTYENRFGGIANLYSAEALLKLKNSHICIIGIGGVGSWVVEALARTGIGELTLIEMDDICVTNVNRQIHAHSASFGKLKTEEMQTRIMNINPDCKVHIIDDFLTVDNISEYINQNYDYIIDAIDNAKVKAALLAFCKRNKIKVITTGAAGGKSDMSKIAVTDITKTIQDPLLASVRRTLKQKHKLTFSPKKNIGIRAVYSTEPVKINRVTNCNVSSRISCNTGLGSITMVTATFGFYAASEVVNHVINKT